jgi:hypothetical protein
MSGPTTDDTLPYCPVAGQVQAELINRVVIPASASHNQEVLKSKGLVENTLQDSHGCLWTLGSFAGCYLVTELVLVIAGAVAAASSA